MKKMKENLINFFVEKKFKNRKVIIALWVFVLTLFSLGYSYAAFFTVKSNKNNQTIQTGNLSVSYGGSPISINSTNMQPLSDEDGLNQTDASIIYIQNNAAGNIDSDYVLTIGYDMDNFLSRSDYKSTDRLTPLEYIKVAVYEYSGGKSTLIHGPVSVGELTPYIPDPNEMRTTTIDDYRNIRYAIHYDTLGATSGNTKTYQVKIWLSDTAPAYVSGTYFYVNSAIQTEASGSRLKYSFKGKLTTYTSAAPYANVEVSIANGYKTAITDASGNFEINDILPGVYTFEILDDYYKAYFRSTLVIKEGKKKSVTWYDDYTAGAEYPLPLYTYYAGCTINGFLVYSGLTKGSDTITCGTYEYFYPAVNIVGDYNKDIGTITFKVDNWSIQEISYVP